MNDGHQSIDQPAGVDDAGAEATKAGIQVIARAASILRALEHDPDGLSLGTLAARVGLARSTVQRIVGALIDEQLLISAGTRAGVTLGPALVRLAASANVATDRIARPFLQALSRELGETVDLSTLQGRTAMFVDQVVGSSRLVAISAIGESFPLHCTANGKALLALADPARVATLLGPRLARHTAATQTDRARIVAEIARVRETQLAFDLEEHAEGICAIGTGFIDPLGREFALSVPMPVARFAAKRDAVCSDLLAARDAIIQAVPGSRGPSAHATPIDLPGPAVRPSDDAR